MIYLVYNDVIFRDVELRSWNQQIIHDESNTDLVYSRFEIAVAATITDFFSTNDDPGEGNSIAPGATPPLYPTVERMAYVQSALQHPRGDFWFIVGGQENAEDEELTMLIAAGKLERPGQVGVPDDQILFHPFQADSTKIDRSAVLDLDNGPHTSGVTVGPIYGGRAMRASMTIRVCRLACNYDTGEPSFPVADPNLRGSQAVLSNRWSIEESKDESWHTTRTLSGTLVTESTKTFANLYRYLCVPPLLTGYKRMSQSFTQTPDNLKLRYRITDRQVHASPPPPATKWRGTHTESTTNQGARQTANLSVRLEGPPGVDKRQLIAAAGNVLTARIQDIQKQGENPRGEEYATVLKSLAIVDHMAEPVVELSASVHYTSADYKWLAMRVQNMVAPEDPTLGIPGYDPRISPKPLEFDSETPAGIFSCYLQTPCNVWHGVAEADEKITAVSRAVDKAGSYPPDRVQYQEIENLPQDKPRIESSSSSRYDVYNYPYTTYTIRNRYENGTGILHLPLTGQYDVNQTSAVVKVHDGITRRILEVEAVRDGREPTVPQVTEDILRPTGLREQLLSSELTPYAPELISDAYTKRYGFFMRLVYALSRELNSSDVLEVGSLPIDIDSPGDNEIRFDDIKDTEQKISSNY